MIILFLNIWATPASWYSFCFKSFFFFKIPCLCNTVNKRTQPTNLNFKFHGNRLHMGYMGQNRLCAKVRTSKNKTFGCDDR